MTFDAGVMPIVMQQCEALGLSEEEVQNLWDQTREYRDFTDDEVTVRCVAADEMQKLNHQYRDQNKPTNVLTFSYGDATHDVALCLEVAEREARERAVTVRRWVAQ